MCMGVSSHMWVSKPGYFLHLLCSRCIAANFGGQCLHTWVSWFEACMFAPQVLVAHAVHQIATDHKIVHFAEKHKNPPRPHPPKKELEKFILAGTFLRI